MHKYDSLNKVHNAYLNNRKRVLDYSNVDMNLRLDNDSQVYIAVFDIPVESIVVRMHTQTLALVFGLNAHLYSGNGKAMTGFEKSPIIMMKMQSLLVSAHQVLDEMELVENTDFYNSQNIRAYLKTGKGVYFKELQKGNRKDDFLTAMMMDIMSYISKAVENMKR